MKTFIREGRCKRCGYCCEFFHILHRKLPELRRDLEFLLARGFQIVQENDNWMEIAIHVPCPKLVTNEKGHKSCMVYENRPGVCMDYPQPAEIFQEGMLDPTKSLGPKCGFRFVEEKDPTKGVWIGRTKNDGDDLERAKKEANRKINDSDIQ